MLFDPQNMGLDTLFVQLSAILAEIWRIVDFSVMAALICIKMTRGTSGQLFNIAHRFLRIFSNLEMPIRSWFPGGAWYPFLPTYVTEASRPPSWKMAATSSTAIVDDGSTSEIIPKVFLYNSGTFYAFMTKCRITWYIAHIYWTMPMYLLLKMPHCCKPSHCDCIAASHYC